MAQIQSQTLLTFVVALVVASCCQARSAPKLAASPARPVSQDDETESVISSPNQEFYGDSQIDDIRKMTTGSSPVASLTPAASASDSRQVPVYVSPFVRSARSTSNANAASSPSVSLFDPQESSDSYASAQGPVRTGSPSDLKASASYGHGHHGGHHGYGYDTKGWLDMGAWTGGKGSFGWYADYPVGGKHHGYGK